MEVVRTESFDRAFRNISDMRALSKIGIAIQRMHFGNFGDSRAVGHGVIETRIHYGPGYRIYFTRRGSELLVLLLCGDKRMQQADINRAVMLLNNV